MSVIVTDDGFGPEDWTAGFAPVEALGDRSREALALDLSADLLPEALHALVPAFGRIALIRIPFASFADGRGFTLARQLRLLGYRGRLRAAGHVIADQYAMARRSGGRDEEDTTLWRKVVENVEPLRRKRPRAVPAGEAPAKPEAAASPRLVSELGKTRKPGTAARTARA